MFLGLNLMNFDFITNLFSHAVGPKTSLPLFVASGIILFSPRTILIQIGLVDIQSEYRFMIGTVFVFALAMLLGTIILSAINMSKQRWNWFWSEHHLKRGLYDLTEDEKAALRPFIINGSSQELFNLADGVVAILEAKVILNRASTMSVSNTDFNYIMQPWAKDHLMKHKELLD